MPKLLLVLLLGSLLCACHKGADPETGPESILRYKIDGNLVEIRGSLITGNTGSKFSSRTYQAGRFNVISKLYFEAENRSDTFSFFIFGLFPPDSVSYVIPSLDTSAYFSSTQYGLKGQLGGVNTTGFTFIINPMANRTSTGRFTANGRFYGSSFDSVNHKLIHITEGEFQNVWME